MGRIRSIKPEIPQSESLSRVCIQARLTFLLLFTLADDAGRLRGEPKMLLSLLYPYDIIELTTFLGWLEQLEAQGCIQQYKIDGKKYIQINNWLKHQKINRPTPARYPSPEINNSTNLEKISEDSVRIQALSHTEDSLRTQRGIEDRGSRIEDRGSRIEDQRARSEPSVSTHGGNQTNFGKTSISISLANDGTTRFELLKSEWDTIGLNPPFRKNFLELSGEDRSEILATFRAYTDDEIIQAMKNYFFLKNSELHCIEFPYRSLASFLRKGVEKFSSEAKPQEVYKRPEILAEERIARETHELVQKVLSEEARES